MEGTPRKTAGHSGNAGGGGAEDERGWERMGEDWRGWERTGRAEGGGDPAAKPRGTVAMREEAGLGRKRMREDEGG